jgi:hypothetical protein
MGTKEDLSVAYSPGVAEPCLSIQQNEKYAYEYTAKGHLVGVITNGTAVLGLGNIGPLAGEATRGATVGILATSSQEHTMTWLFRDCVCSVLVLWALRAVRLQVNIRE